MVFMGLFSAVSVGRLNFAAALLHAAQAVIVLVIVCWQDDKPLTSDMAAWGGGARPGHFTLERIARVWSANGTIGAVTVPSGVIDVRVLMIVFFALSAMFQGTASAFMEGRSGNLRYLEYSLTSALMILAIAVEAGIRDVYALVCMFVLLWVTQLTGIVAELYSHDSRAPWGWLPPHLVGWVTFVAAYAPILDSFLLCNSHSERQAPGFVRALVLVEFLLFACFGIVQGYCLAAKAWLPLAAGYGSVGPPSPMSMIISDAEGGVGGPVPDSTDPAEAIDLDGEGAFIVLSLAAKTSLAWIILAPALLA
jgi:hypothetical protein